jgi:kynureninase
VFAFHEEQGLTPGRLRDISRRQVGRLEAAFERLDVHPDEAHVEAVPDDRRAGFLAIRVPAAPAVAQALRTRGVYVDARGDILRLGPAPYLRDDQLEEAVTALGDVLRRV